MVAVASIKKFPEDKILNEVKVIVPEAVLPDLVPEIVPVGFKFNVIVYGPKAVSRIVPRLLYTPAVTEKVVRLVILA